MIRQAFLFAVLLATGCATSAPPSGPSASDPTSADIAVLQRATKECGLHQGALSFVRYAVPREPVIKMTRAFGDTQDQLDCALKYFPPDFYMRFGAEVETDAPR
jgi:hypothetical protein